MWVGPGLAELFLGREHPAARLLKTSLPESTAALLGAALLFVLPGGNGARALTWKEAVQIDWGVVLLYGGGMALGNLAQQTGLTEAIGRQTTSWLAIQSPFTLLVAASALAVLVSEATSNTASATIVVPFVISYAKELHLDPVEPALAATMACSLGFMLPVSTPCNAIVYGSGRIPLARMIRYGMFLDMMGIAVIVALTRVLRPLVA
jgi:sodium-dependent dicarboxylate transporter 2/3/5